MKSCAIVFVQRRVEMYAPKMEYAREILTKKERNTYTDTTAAVDFIAFAKPISVIRIVHFGYHDQTHTYTKLRTTYLTWFSSTVYWFLFCAFTLMRACVHMSWLTMVGIK